MRRSATAFIDDLKRKVGAVLLMARRAHYAARRTRQTDAILSVGVDTRRLKRQLWLEPGRISRAFIGALPCISFRPGTNAVLPILPH